MSITYMTFSGNVFKEFKSITLAIILSVNRLCSVTSIRIFTKTIKTTLNYQMALDANDSMFVKPLIKGGPGVKAI